MRQYEDELDAIAAMVAASRKPRKEIACDLWPNLKPDTAYAKLAAKLSREGSEHFQIGEVIKLMVSIGQFDLLYFMCDCTAHKRPERRAEADEQARLAEAVLTATHVLQQAINRLDDMQPTRRPQPPRP